MSTFTLRDAWGARALAALREAGCHASLAQWGDPATMCAALRALDAPQVQPINRAGLVWLLAQRAGARPSTPTSR